MARDDRLVRLSHDHHHALVLALRIQRELPVADEIALGALIADATRFWSAGLQPHIEAENDALLNEIAPLGDEGLALAGRLQREHRELDEAMTFLRNGGRGDRSGALARFGELLAAHIRWEERDLLEWLEQRLSSEALDRAHDVFAARLPSTPVVCPTPQTL